MAAQPSAPTGRHFWWAAVGMLVFAIYGSLLPFQYEPKAWDEAVAKFESLQRYDPTDLGARGDWVISVVMYAVLTYLLMGALSVDRRRIIGLVAAPIVAICCVVLAVGIEFAQVYFPPRTVSINDIQVESLGGFIGIIAWVLAGQRITGWMRRFARVSTLAGLASRLLPGYLAALLVVQLMPFDFVVQFDELAVKYNEGKVRLSPWPSATLSGWDFVTKSAMNLACFVPLGFLHSLARRHKNALGRECDVPWASFAAPLIIEVLQFFVYSRTCNTADVITGAVGVAIGWRWARRVHADGLPTGPIAAISALRPALFLIWLAAVIYLYWRPFDFTTNPTDFSNDNEDWSKYGLRRFPLAPFADYYWGNKYNALDQFVRKAFAFAPLGILFGISIRDLNRRFAGFATVMTALAVAIVLEIGRYYLPSRAPSTTDVLIACAGAWAGFQITKFIRIIIWAESTLTTWEIRSAPKPPTPPLHWIVGP